jgi:phospholipid-translocating ATPase
MLFKKLAMEYCMFSEENMEDMRKILDDNCTLYDTPGSDYVEDMKHHNSGEASLKVKKKRREEGNVFRDMVTALCLCHNVTPVINNNGEREL